MKYEVLFDESYERILSGDRSGADFFHTFYERFLDEDEEIAKRFENTDMNRQQTMLKKAFYNLFSFYASGHSDSFLRRIAESHNRKHLDIRPEFYDRWLECLIATVKQYDEAFCDDVELAWRLVMTPGITYMKFKYDKD